MLTSYSYLVLLSNPLTSLIQFVPQVLAAFACLGRIQAFLEKDTREDCRKPSAQSISFEEKSVSGLEQSNDQEDKIPVVSITKGSFGWTEGTVTLAGIDLAILAR